MHTTQVHLKDAKLEREAEPQRKRYGLPPEPQKRTIGQKSWQLVLLLRAGAKIRQTLCNGCCMV
jgi:hypothetical protein